MASLKVIVQQIKGKRNQTQVYVITQAVNQGRYYALHAISRQFLVSVDVIDGFYTRWY